MESGKDRSIRTAQEEVNRRRIGKLERNDHGVPAHLTIPVVKERRYERLMRVLVAVEPAAERRRLLAALKLFPKFDVRSITGFELTSITDADRTDYLIVWFELIQKLRETDANAFVKLSRQARIILALRSDRLLDAASTLHLADAWLFTDHVMHQLCSLVGLSDSGYTIVPSGVGRDFGLDSLRLDLLHQLGDDERQVLYELAIGNSNREIALRLNISEPQTKALVRNILGKLHFRNRTEAAVFIARRQNEVAYGGLSG